MDIIDFSDDYIPLKTTLYESIKNIPEVLARCAGQFFVPNGVSRNKRYYSEELWRRVLNASDTKKALADGMLGTLVHPSDDKMAHPMYSSHVVKRLWIDRSNVGMGEAYVMDTPIGRIVNSFSQSGLVNLYVSSRAYGQYKEGVTREGVPVIDDSNFVLKTFDFVTEPGFLAANPKFYNEALNEAFNSLKNCYEQVSDTKVEIRREATAAKILRQLNLALGK